ncbi:MAG: hypothetical protein AAGA83_13815 [Cyanobacteria bacterium P01_F01_bin.116]
MTITYTNRSLQTYYLHQGTTKTGKPKYYIGHEDSLDVLVKTYLPHLGQESFYDLH